MMQRKRMRSFSLAVGFVLSFIPAPFANASDSLEEGTRFLQNAQNVFIHLAKRVTPSVVGISPVGEAAHSSPPPGKKGHKRDLDPKSPSGSGSGVIIDKQGFIVTNGHVVGDADEVQVQLSDKTELIGKVIGKDSDTDLAVVKIDAKEGLPFVSLGDSKRVEVGQWVMAVGNPFGLDRTVTIGVVSGLGRENVNLSRYENFIQTDASINPGNSGGPLFNIQGEVVGINTAIINVAQGIGFAIPADMVQTVTQQLMSHGKVTRGWLGVGIQPLTPALAKKFNVKEDEGILVNEVFEGDPAAQAGIEPGDIILKVDGKAVGTTNTLARVIAGFLPGAKVAIEVMREGKTQMLTLTLAEKKDGATMAAIPPPARFLGILVEALTPEQIKEFKLKDDQGVIITDVESGSPADLEGLKAGDIIKEIEGTGIVSLDDFQKAAKAAETSETVLFRIGRENRSLYIVLKQQNEE